VTGAAKTSSPSAEIDTNRLVTTKLSGTIDNATATHAIEAGWTEFRGP